MRHEGRFLNGYHVRTRGIIPVLMYINEPFMSSQILLCNLQNSIFLLKGKTLIIQLWQRLTKECL